MEKKWTSQLSLNSIPYQQNEVALDYFDLRGTSGQRDGNAEMGWKPLTWTSDNEQELLWDIASGQQLSGPIIEIGCAWGGSAALLCTALRASKRKERIYTFDPLALDGVVFAARQLAALSVFRRFSEIVYTCASSDYLQDMFHRPLFRMAFVDGDHGTEWAWRDIKNVAPLMLEDGLVIIHDVAPSPFFPGPNEVWRSANAEEDGLSLAGTFLKPIARYETCGVFRVHRPGEKDGG